MLAFEATKLCRGEAEAKMAEETAKKTFEQGGMGAGLPTFAMESDMGIVDTLVMAGLCKSKSDARRMIVAGAVAVNEQKISDDKFVVVRELAKNGKILVSSGKKNKAVLEIK